MHQSMFLWAPYYVQTVAFDTGRFKVPLHIAKRPFDVRKRRQGDVRCPSDVTLSLIIIQLIVRVNF